MRNRLIKSCLIFFVAIAQWAGLVVGQSSEEKAAPGFIDRLKPVGRILNLMDEGWTVWGCAPIYDETGKVHVFFARWRHGDNWKRVDWFRTGQIAHAVADKPEGPYEVLDVVLEGRGGGLWDGTGVINPQIYKVGGRFVLLYTGVNWKEGKPLQGQGVGMAMADSLYGPWEIVSDREPIIKVGSGAEDFDNSNCNNPAMVVSPEGKFLIYYKGRSLKDDRAKKDGTGKINRRIGLAIADTIEGPYEKYPGNPILDHSPKDYEDPYVWYENGKYKMLMHDLSFLKYGCGLYLESGDGIRWSEPIKGYPSAREAFGVRQRLETPILLMKDGRPDYLYNNRGGSDSDKVFSGFIWKVERPDK